MAVLSRIITICVLFVALRTGLAAPPCKTRSHTAPSATTSQPGEQIPAPVNNPMDATSPTPTGPTPSDPPVLTKPVSNLAGTPPDDSSRFLKSHNDIRKLHGASDLIWDENLATRANAYASKCIWGHSNAQGVGENLAVGYASLEEAVIEGWTNSEIGDHQPGVTIFDHFSQVVWKSTTHVGCAAHVCHSIQVFPDQPAWTDSTYIVCNYSPPGNVEGQYNENVQL